MSLKAARILVYQSHLLEFFQFQILLLLIFVANMLWHVKQMVKLRFRIHSQYMSHGLECVMLTIQEDQIWIFLHHRHLQIKIISKAREFQILFKKKLKYLISFTFRITLTCVLMDVAYHTKHADAVVKLLQVVSLPAAI